MVGCCAGNENCGYGSQRTKRTPVYVDADCGITHTCAGFSTGGSEVTARQKRLTKTGTPQQKRLTSPFKAGKSAPAQISQSPFKAGKSAPAQISQSPFKAGQLAPAQISQSPFKAGELARASLQPPWKFSPTRSAFLGCQPDQQPTSGY